MVKLSYAAPWNDSEATPNGYALKPWTPEAMSAYEAIGGWFKLTLTGDLHPRYNVAGRRQFKQAQPHNRAVSKGERLYLAMSEQARRMTPSERMLLLAQLSER